ncbi:hypothetical protein [Aestuariibacter salexigens]|uniref:hypothetical protein n=1 Tax=Aestuariibacter salexigens TaxID=226010 RepID=UPI0003F667DD|nr:hypothetical protein [Aestuariibacter salexigens]
MVPDSAIEDVQLPEKHMQAIAAFAFANPPANPNAKVDITDFSHPTLTIDGNNLRVTSKN